MNRCWLGPQHALDARDGRRRRRDEVGVVEVDAGAVHRAQDAVGDVGRPRIGKELPPPRLRLGRRCLGHGRESLGMESEMEGSQCARQRPPRST